MLKTRQARTLVTAGALVAAVSVMGCESPVTPDQDVELTPEAHLAFGARGRALDAHLRRTILRATGGKGLVHLQLPESHQLGRIPQDPKNRMTPQKVALGQFLYHETALAVDNVRPEGREAYSCASCHFAQAGFQANVPQGIAEGGSGFGLAGEGRVPHAAYALDQPDVQPIRTPTVMNGAFQELMLWNGQFGGVGGNLGTEAQWTAGSPKESNFLGLHGLETQAHAGMKVHRMVSIEASRVATIPEYIALFKAAFPGDRNPINRLNSALAIGAFERTVLANRTPWQRWLRGDIAAMTDDEKRGAILFFGKAGCVECHNGPALNSMTFHALGMNDLDGAYDPSRVNLVPTGGTIPDGVRQGRGGFTTREADFFKWKTPQLYNLESSPFYGHGASFGTVRQVVEYKNAAIPQNAVVPDGQLASAFIPLGLKPHEIDDLVAFLQTGLYDADLMRYVPTRLPSGNCTPVNDPQARIDLGC